MRGEKTQIFRTYLDGLAKFHIHSQDIVSQEKLFPIECDFAPSLEEATNGPEETGFD